MSNSARGKQLASNRVKTSVIRGAGTSRASSALNSGSIATFDPKKKVPANPLEAAEAAYSEALEQGYNDGLAQARAEIETAMEDSNKRVRRALNAMEEAVRGFDEHQTTALADVENSIVNAAFSIARAVLQREITTAVDPGAEAIARAFKLAPGREAAIVRLNPDDAATLNITQVSAMGRPIEILADPAIENGGCIVEIGDTTIDSQISSALVHVADALAVSNVVAGSDLTSSRTTASEPPLS